MELSNTPPPPELLAIAQAAMLENTRTQLAFLDRNFNFVCVNSAYARGSGHSAEDLIGRNHFELFPSEENRAIFEHVRDSGETVEFPEKPFVFPAQPERGVTFWDWTLAPVGPGAPRAGCTAPVWPPPNGPSAGPPPADEPMVPPESPDAQGTPSPLGTSTPWESSSPKGSSTVQGLVLSLRDVTEQVRARQALERSEANYRNLFAGMREAFALHEIICDAGGVPVDYRFLDANPAFGELTGLDPLAIIGKTVLEVLPDTEPYWIATYGAVALTGVPARFENYSQALDAWFQVAASSPVPGQFMAIFTDVTERRRMEDELRRARDELQGEADRLEARVQERTAQLTAANLALQRQAQLLENVSDAIISTDRERRITTWNRMAEELYGWQAAEAIGRPIQDVIPTEFLDCSAQEVFHQMAQAGRWRGEMIVQHQDGHQVCVEATAMVLKDEEGKIVGYVGVNRDVSARREAEEALRESKRQLQAFSHQLVEAQENERRAIARELHDEVGQALTVMKLQMVEFNSMAGDRTAVAVQTKEVLGSIDGIMETLHRLAVSLRPPSLDRVGLVPSLEQLAESFQGRTGILTEVVTVGLEEMRLTPEIETMVYRVVQEALTNAARHSNAAHVGVIVERRNRRLVTIVEDNGDGFDVEAAMRSGRLGLLGIRERAEMLGGKFAVESMPGGGTTLFVDVPYDG